MEEVRLRGKSFELNPTTVTVDWDDLDPYDFNTEYIKVIKENNHETLYRIQYKEKEKNLLKRDSVINKNINFKFIIL